MGSSLAQALLSAGHQVTVYNRTAAKAASLAALGALVVATPYEAIMASDATLVVLADFTCMQALLRDGATRASLAGRKLLSVTTTTTSEITALARELALLDCSLSEVTVTVYPDVVQRKEGQFLLGCCAEDSPFWSSILGDIGTFVHRAGEVGDASRTDLALVIPFVFNIAATAYAAAVANKMNVPAPLIQHQVTENPTLTIHGAKGLLPQMFARNYAQDMASVQSTIYALTMAVEAIRPLGVPMEVLDGLLGLFAAASERGLGAKDAASVYEVLLEPDAVPM